MNEKQKVLTPGDQELMDLPEEVRQALISGSREEAQIALDRINQMEEVTGQQILSQSGIDTINYHRSKLDE